MSLSVAGYEATGAIGIILRGFPSGEFMVKALFKKWPTWQPKEDGAEAPSLFLQFSEQSPVCLTCPTHRQSAHPVGPQSVSEIVQASD